jgi:ABC-type uncharacterized transport system auxiliary subunit
MAAPARSGGRSGMLAIVLVLALVSCRSGPGPRDSFYRIEASPQIVALPAPLLVGVLEVERFGGEAVMAALPLLYRKSASSAELLRYGYQLWTDPPPLMLQRAIGAGMEASGLATRVVYPEQRVRPDFVLRGRIERLEHIREERVALLALQLDLAADQGTRPLYSGRYVERVEASDASVHAVVLAFEVGLGRILDRFRSELEESLRAAR